MSEYDETNGLKGLCRRCDGTGLDPDRAWHLTAPPRPAPRVPCRDCHGSGISPEAAEPVARLFHETYERLAPSFGYSTRERSAVPWGEVPDDNRRLMIATAGFVVARQRGRDGGPDLDFEESQRW